MTKHLINRTWASLLVLICVLPQQSYGASEFYSISRSLRALGMGGAFYSLSNDEYALFYNPAGLSRYEYTPEFMFQIQADLATKLPSALNTLTNASGKKLDGLISSLTSFQGTPLYAGVTPLFPYYIRKHFAAGL